MTQPQRILVAYDGSPGANAALTDLVRGRAGLPEEAEALVLCVADVWNVARVTAFGPFGLDAAPATKSQLDAIEAAERDELRRARRTALNGAKALRAAHSRWVVRAESCAETPAWAMVRRAETWRADLIVIGSHGRSALGRVVLGSVAHAVVREAPCSVRIVHGASGRAKAPVCLIVGYDGSPDADAAVEAVAERTWPAGSSVRLVTAAAGRSASAATKRRSCMSGGDGFAWLDPHLTRASQRLLDAGLSVTSVVRAGDPRRVLVQEAARRKADGLFVGARGLRGIKRFLLGSVSTAVAMQARCPIEVIRSVCARVPGAHAPSRNGARQGPAARVAAGAR